MIRHISRLFNAVSSKPKKSMFVNLNCSFSAPVSLRNIWTSSILNVKIYKENENIFAYNLMVNYGYATDIFVTKNAIIVTAEDVDELLDKNWENESTTSIYEAFQTITSYCSSHNICISNRRFDIFIDNLTDNMRNMSDEQLKDIFYFLNQWPETPSVRTRNYIEVWAALDDQCVLRLKQWSTDQMLSYISLIYMLNVTKASDFAYKCLQRLTNKAKQLTPAQFVQTLFFIGIFRESTKEMHNLEIYLEKHIKDFTVDELAIISMGFFKSSTPLREANLVYAIIERVIETHHSINEISLSALLKIIRYSMRTPPDDIIYRLQESLIPEVSRLSLMCCVHIALLGTTSLVYHENALNTISERVLPELSKTRLKDLERLAFTFGIFNFKPKTAETFFETLVQELQCPKRNKEFIKHGRSLANCVGYLNLCGIYHKELIHKVLGHAFLESTYGKQIYNYGREILALHNIADIFFRDCDINRLSPKTVSVLAKKYTDFLPNPNYKKQFNVTEKIILDMIDILEKSRGSAYFHGDHILTHYQRGGKQ